MNIEEVVTALGARKNGTSWVSRCPICLNEKPTLSIWLNDGKVGFRCYYSVGFGCHPISLVYWLQSKGVNITITDLTTETTPSQTWPEIWHAAKPIWNSFAHDYLHTRGISLEEIVKYGFRDTVSLRCVDRFKHPQGPRLPVMLGLITNCRSGHPIGLHRTYLNHLGTNKTNLKPEKMTLGSINGGVIRLADRSEEPDVLRIAEGIETALSVMQIYGVPCWSSVSAGNLTTLKLPLGVKHLIIYADNDDMGRKMARAAGIHYSLFGYNVEAVYPKDHEDFNDQLRRVT